jgi:uncharacterized membrane protein (DUF106 family)
MKMTIIDELWNWVMASLVPYQGMPKSTFLVIAIALGLSLITNAANRFLVDIERMRSITKEVTAWRKELDKAKKSNDKRLMAKVMKKQEAIMQLQSKMTWDRMKVSLLFLGPFWLVWLILTSFFKQTTVAVSPFIFPWLMGENLPLFSWYLLCSFAAGLPLSRMFGINPED